MSKAKAMQELARRELEARKKVADLDRKPLISDKLVSGILSAISDNSLKAEVESAINAVNGLNEALTKQANGLEKIAEAQARAFSKLGQSQSDQMASLEANLNKVMESIQKTSDGHFEAMQKTSQGLESAIKALKPVDYTMNIKRAGAFISSVDLKAQG
jgi:hypothetical protein